MEFELYRIIQEALVNARKHAHAKTINVTLRTTRGELIAKVVDDGRGLPAPVADLPCASQMAAPTLTLIEIFVPTTRPFSAIRPEPSFRT